MFLACQLCLIMLAQKGNLMDKFNVPVVLLLFKRKDTALRIVDRLREIRAARIYIMSDEGRNDEERKKVREARIAVEKAIDWECKVIRNYASNNRGVYGNIALGAKWIFQKEPWAIFLEDDNLPETTFFPYCEELLKMYEDDTRILWICGTNYLGKYVPEDGSSYMFTKHMLPCGWASWSSKFLKYYDGEVKAFQDNYVRKRFLLDFPSKAMRDVYETPLLRYEREMAQGKQPYSWDYQMCFSVRTNSMYGISPVNNQIKNIGVDEDSEHGGNTMSKVMTRRFCGMESYPLQLPLRHPKCVMTDIEYEKKIDKLVTPPLRNRIRHFIAKNLKKMFGLRPDEPFKKVIM